VGLSITFGADASKFDFYQVGFGTKTITDFSQCTKDQIEAGYDSGLNPKGYKTVSFKKDGSKLSWDKTDFWVKER